MDGSIVAWMADPEAWVSLAVLTVMEIVLGIDNIVFLSIISARLPHHQRVLGQRLGLAGALLTRVGLLLTVNWLAHLESTLFTLVRDWSGRDLVLLAGGVFLLWKATREIYENVEHPHNNETGRVSGTTSLAAVVAQIMLIDIVFSVDSVVTAVGMADHVEVMVVAIIIAVLVMMLFARPVGDFVIENPSVKVLALAFLVLIGATLVMEATGQHVAKGYVYAAMGFSLVVQMLNLRMDKRANKVPEQPEPS
jgi:predicted tellurium resistance membrane protein TerC